MEEDPLYIILEKSKCTPYYNSFKDLNISIDDISILQKDDLANVIKEPLLLALFWRNLQNFKEEEKQKEFIDCSTIQIQETFTENTRKRKPKGLLLEERLSKKQHIILKDIVLHNLPNEPPTDSDYKRIAEQILDYLKKAHITKLRHGQLDGLCGYLIAKHSILCENKYSGYEKLKSKIVNVLRNYRSFQKKKNPNKTNDQDEQQFITVLM